MKDILLNTTMKPYGKLSKLIHEAYVKGIITSDECAAFDEELELLVNGQNRSHNTIPRSYIKYEGGLDSPLESNE